MISATKKDMYLLQMTPEGFLEKIDPDPARKTATDNTQKFVRFIRQKIENVNATIKQV